MVASNSRLPAMRGGGVDPEEEPSVEWGWHGDFPRAKVIAGWVSTAIVLSFLFGNHTGNVENIWLVGVALVMAAGLVLHAVNKRNAWRR